MTNTPRAVIVEDSGVEPDTKEIVRITVDHILGDDPKAYFERLRARIDAKKAAAAQNA